MNLVPTELIAELEAAAVAAQQEEDAARKRMVEEVARLERRRAFAFRRMHLVRLLVGAAANAETEETSAGVQRAAVRRDLGWGGEGDFHRAVLDRLQPVGQRVWQFARGLENARPAAVRTELEAFETWYEATYGNSFYALFDQQIAEVALVEP
jgi:hypothetical protein